MSLQFYFGASGAGKSRLLYEEINRRAAQNPKQNFLIIVPDQFTMQAQKDLVLLNDRGGILNIDVLSFGRLGHRILEEVGGQEIPVLDDTGKSLVLQKVAAGLKDQLPTLGSFLHRQGYIHEVKSAISEFMQYGIAVEDMGKLIEFAKKRGALVKKLEDLATLYKGFLDYIRGNFITTEETLDVVRRAMPKSRLLPGSVVVFDGFTGFTPIQTRVISQLMSLCGEVIVSLTLGEGENPYVLDGEQNLFYLSKKTVADLDRQAEALSIERKQDVLLLSASPEGNARGARGENGMPHVGSRTNLRESGVPGREGAMAPKGWESRCHIRRNAFHRFQKSPALRHLEKHMFRYASCPYEMESGQEIRLFETTDPREEVRQAGLEIRRLVREEGLAFRDMAVILGDLAGYAPYVETEFAQMDIPCYIDRTRKITLNPMIEYIKSALELYEKDFSYESVFRYLRSGLADLTWEEVDRLENYCLETGIKGYHAYSRLFTRKTREMKREESRSAEQEQALGQKHVPGQENALGNPATEQENAPRQESVPEQERSMEPEHFMEEGLFTEVNQATEGSSSTEGEEALAEMNALRQRLMNQVEMLHLKGKEPVKTYVNALYDFLVSNKVQQKLSAYEARFQEAGDLIRAREYAQIYRLVMELLDQIYALLGEEPISLREFAEILEAGFDEIQVGTIPQNVDRVLVGDMERTRLQQVKTLFFLGVNDGNIPKGASKGGIISDMDREFLRESDLELAPSPRQQMYIQRFYLYLNMTKPSRRLYLSWCKVNSAGKSIRPAYLVDAVRKLFPGLEVECPQQRDILEQIVTGQEGAGYLAKGLREYVEGGLREREEQEFFTIYQTYGGQGLKEKRDFLTQAAFRRYQDTGLSAAVARALYGLQIEASVTRLETYAACAYRHFLQYGLTLRERQEFSFENVDMGNVYHAVLEQFAGKLKEKGYTWFDFPREFAETGVREALEHYAADYRETVLYSSARNEYAITRMGRILTRTVLTLQKQLRRGSFTPESFELSFHHMEAEHAADDLGSINLSLSEREKLRLQGRIDRIDIAQEGEKVYVKVIDYKSGRRRFDLAALYYGLQLQLVVYMNAAQEVEEKRHQDKEIVPAALLYYRIDDPSVDTPVELTEEEIDEEIGKQLRMNGVVNSAPGIVELLDREMGDKSDIIPVERKKDGAFSARSSVLSGEELRTVSDYVSRKVVEIGREILDGTISLNPYEKGSEEACTYCAYKKVCGFEPAMPGCEKRRLEDMDREEALRRMGV